MLRTQRFKGIHGYDPERVPEVRSIFYAWGAGIRPGYELQGMRTVDVHPTLANWLGIEPGTPLDGRARTGPAGVNSTPAGRLDARSADA